MIVTAMLAWWDEPATDLYECVTSMKVICDRVVAADGAYEMTPGGTESSSRIQAEAIEQAAYDTGMACRIIQPKTIWKGQVEKRAAILAEAVVGSDWVMAVDSDHRLVGDRDQVRAEIEGIPEADSILHDFHTPAPFTGGQIEQMSPHPWHTKLANKTIKHSLILRCLPEMRIDGTHFGYSGIRRGQRVAIGNWKSDDYPKGRHYELQAPFRVDHLCFYRDRMRLDRNRDYCSVRDEFRNTHGWEP